MSLFIYYNRVKRCLGCRVPYRSLTLRVAVEFVMWLLISFSLCCSFYEFISHLYLLYINMYVLICLKAVSQYFVVLIAVYLKISVFSEAEFMG